MGTQRFSPEKRWQNLGFGFLPSTDPIPVLTVCTPNREEVTGIMRLCEAPSGLTQTFFLSSVDLKHNNSVKKKKRCFYQRRLEKIWNFKILKPLSISVHVSSLRPSSKCSHWSRRVTTSLPSRTWSIAPPLLSLCLSVFLEMVSNWHSTQ